MNSLRIESLLDESILFYYSERLRFQVLAHLVLKIDKSKGQGLDLSTLRGGGIERFSQQDRTARFRIDKQNTHF